MNEAMCKYITLLTDSRCVFPMLQKNWPSDMIRKSFAFPIAHIT